MSLRNNEALLDVNVLIAGLFEDHEHHSRARPYIANLDRFYTCPITQSGFLRFATRTSEVLPSLSIAEAHKKLTQFSQSPGHVFLSDDVPFVALSVRWVKGHKQWTDAYLLHLARHHGLVVASLDVGMKSLDDPNARALFLLD